MFVQQFHLIVNQAALPIVILTSLAAISVNAFVHLLSVFATDLVHLEHSVYVIEMLIIAVNALVCSHLKT
jgi:hypothetical protein